MASKFQPPTAEDLRVAFDQFSKERPRAAAVMAAAWVDDALRAYMESYLARDKAVASSLLRADAPLGSFGVRIKLAFLLGLIGPKLRDDLDRIREIRNEFAHVRTRVSFKTESVVTRCNSLLAGDMLNDAVSGRSLTTQDRFVVTAFLLTEILIHLAEDAEPPKAMPEFYLPYVRRFARSPGLVQMLAAVEDASAG